MTDRSDGSLAPVTYLFGSVPVSEPSDAAIAEQGAAQATPHEAEARWTVPGIDLQESGVMTAEPTKQEKRAHNVGLNALTRRGQSVDEMRKLLESRELDEETIEAEIKRLKSVGLLDDFDLADTLVRTLSERKGLGASAIKSQLRQRKIDPVAIDAALEQLDTDDELTRAIEVATKRAGQLSSYDQATAKRRLTAFMQRRGYSGSILSAATAAALAPSAAKGSGPRFV